MKHSITLQLIPLVPPANSDKGSADGYFGPTRHYLEVEVYYNVGGMNYFSGTRPARGYYLRATPVTRQSSQSGGETHGFTLFSGHAVFLEPAKRFSDKTLAKIAESAKQHPEYAALKQRVIDANHLTLMEPEAAHV